MPALIHTAKPMPEGERNARVYAGDIIVFRGHPRVVEFVNVLRARCVSSLGDHPEQAHTRQSSAETESLFERLHAQIRDDESINDAWRAALEAIGVDLAATYGDGVVVRGQAPNIERSGSRLAPLAPHRDTWGSNIAAQTNWWAPLYATTPERTLSCWCSKTMRTARSLTSREYGLVCFIAPFSQQTEQVAPVFNRVTTCRSPRCGRLDSRMSPPWATMMVRATARPRPAPPVSRLRDASTR